MWVAMAMKVGDEMECWCLLSHAKVRHEPATPSLYGDVVG